MKKKKKLTTSQQMSSAMKELDTDAEKKYGHLPRAKKDHPYFCGIELTGRYLWPEHRERGNTVNRFDLIEGEEYYHERGCYVDILLEKNLFPEFIDEFLEWLESHPKYKNKFELEKPLGLQ